MFFPFFKAPTGTGATTMQRAVARHILVDSESDALELKQQLDGGADFEELARQHSRCPSGKQGGTLGRVVRGEMVQEFDAVVFGDLAVGTVSEPVKTQFGFHLIAVEERT